MGQILRRLVEVMILGWKVMMIGWKVMYGWKVMIW
jgi:hypothetical protein